MKSDWREENARVEPEASGHGRDDVTWAVRTPSPHQSYLHVHRNFNETSLIHWNNGCYVHVNALSLNSEHVCTCTCKCAIRRLSDGISCLIMHLAWRIIHPLPSSPHCINMTHKFRFHPVICFASRSRQQQRAWELMETMRPAAWQQRRQSAEPRLAAAAI